MFPFQIFLIDSKPHLAMYSNNKKNKGISIVGILFFGFIILMVLSYFHISIRAVVESSDAQDNIHYVGGAGKSLWNDYLEKPASYLWNDVWKKIFWQGFISNMERIRNGQPTDYQKFAPAINFNNSQ